jgi:pseudouridine-5'-phosphate glycosidase
MGDAAKKPPRKNPLFGAAVVKAVLRKRGGVSATSALYEGILRDLGVTDEQVEEFLADHAAEVEQAIRKHGRRGD